MGVVTPLIIPKIGVIGGLAAALVTPPQGVWVSGYDVVLGSAARFKV